MPVTEIQTGQAIVEIIGDDKRLQAVLAKSSSGIEAFSRHLTAIGSRIAAAGQMMFAPFREAARVFADFDDQMRRVAAISNASASALASLTKQAKALGASTAFTASDVAAGMSSLGMMGFSPSEISGAMESMMQLSRATGTDLASASSIAANQMRVFGLTAKDATAVADILAATANGSAQTLTDLGDALKVAGPLAKVTGQDLRQVAGALGVLANMGIRGSQAGTAIARSYKQMADPSVQARLRSLGVEVLDINGNLRDMASIWAEFGKVLGSMTDADQLSTLKEVFNDRGMLGGGLLSYNAQAVDDFMRKLRECDGYVADTAETMEGGLGGALRGLSSAWEAVKIATGEAMAALAPMVKALAGLARGLSLVIRYSGPVVPVLATVTAGLAAAGLATSALGVACSLLTAKLSITLHPVQALSKAYWALADAAFAAGNGVVALSNAEAGQLALQKMLAALHIKAAGAITAHGAAVSALGAIYKGAALLGLTNPWIAAAAAIAALTAAINHFTTNRLVSEVDKAVESASNLESRLERTRKSEEGQRDDSKADLDRLKELEELGRQGQLSATQMEFAQRLIDRLAASGHSGIAKLDTAAGAVTLSGSADEDFNAKEVEKEREQIRKRAQARINEMAKLKKELDEALKWRLFGQSEDIKAEARRLEDALKELERANDKEFDRLKELKRQKRAAADAPFVTREQEARALEIEKKLADERLTGTEREIAANEELRKELLAVYDAELKVAQARGDKAAADGIQKQMAAANAQFDERAAGIVRNGLKSAGGIDLAADQARRASQREKASAATRQERELSNILNTRGQGAYQRRLQELITEATDAVAIAAQALSDEQARVTGANSAGGVGVTEEEKASLAAQRELYEEAQKTLDRLQGKLDDVETSPRRLSQAVSHAVGSFSTRMLSQMVGSGSAAEQTARNTAAALTWLGRIADYTQRINLDNAYPTFA